MSGALSALGLAVIAPVYIGLAVADGRGAVLAVLNVGRPSRRQVQAASRPGHYTMPPSRLEGARAH